jgi:alpha/beta superfamily hydrolase
MIDVAHTSSQSLAIPGPRGELEALIDAPESGAHSQIAVICHPHPLHGGTMTNKVAHMLGKSFNAVGASAVRFNFRGVGRSAGEYAHGIGETEDALAVVDWARIRWPSAQIWIAGFSFGGAVAIRAAAERQVQRLITVAPAVDRVEVSADKLPRCPWLVIQGDADEVVPAASVSSWLDSIPLSPDLVLLPGVGHYFHGKLNELKHEVVAWLQRQQE